MTPLVPQLKKRSIYKIENYTQINEFEILIYFPLIRIDQEITNSTCRNITENI
jgi:hypothetical protein